ncbi:hypothetical protein B0H11DRAFT_1756219 [Mycena galericulata]|nr:hypothetical protein B0H11DRAFT_1763264 [Mycena galericulata]KAJ7435354.1 hypothetical protein B0H11DRAFT_1756219 [Mycena galericulata]
MAHEACVHVLPETWVASERVVFGVDGIVPWRWNIKCNACTRARAKAHGVLVQCTKGKWPKSFHICCPEAGPADITRSCASSRRATQRCGPHRTPKPNLHVLKTIKKVEVEVLCPHHNPRRLFFSFPSLPPDGLHANTLALPPLSRIKIRVGAGVFNVTCCARRDD